MKPEEKAFQPCHFSFAHVGHLISHQAKLSPFQGLCLYARDDPAFGTSCVDLSTSHTFFCATSTTDSSPSKTRRISKVIMDLLPTFKDDSPLLQEIGRWAYLTYHERDMIQVYLHLIFSALFPIYIGAHASLYRPPSAKSAKKSRKDEGISEDEDDDEIEVKPMAEGLQPSDAILFPVMAGLTLGGLYLIIKWLNDPAILNRILGYYFSALGVFGVGKLAADALNVGTSFIFPSVWSDGTETYHIDPRISRQVAGHVQKARKSSTRQGVEGKSNPFPGYLSKVGFPKTWSKLQWSIRALLKDRWTFTGYVHGVVEIKYKIRLNDVIGFILGLGTILLYNTVGKTWWLTNLIAFGFCYGTFQLLSPTTFWTGSLVLAGLFVYDIVMVFYTYVSFSSIGHC